VGAESAVGNEYAPFSISRLRDNRESDEIFAGCADVFGLIGLLIYRFSFKHACGELFEHFFGLKCTILCKYGHFLARNFVFV